MINLAWSIILKRRIMHTQSSVPRISTAVRASGVFILYGRHKALWNVFVRNIFVTFLSQSDWNAQCLAVLRNLSVEQGMGPEFQEVALVTV